jgi:hypothetical protein
MRLWETVLRRSLADGEREALALALKLVQTEFTKPLASANGI